MYFLYFVYLPWICRFPETHGMVSKQQKDSCHWVIRQRPRQETHRRFSHSSGQRIASTEDVAKSLCLVRIHQKLWWGSGHAAIMVKLHFGTMLAKGCQHLTVMVHFVEDWNEPLMRSNDSWGNKNIALDPYDCIG